MGAAMAVDGTGQVTAPLWFSWPLFIKRLYTYRRIHIAEIVGKLL